LNIDYQNDNGVTKDVTHTYDRLGWTKDIFDASGKRTLSYEDGVLADETYSDDGDPGTEDPFLGMVIDRKQDSYNRLDEIKVLDPQASQLYKAEYGYDDASRLETAIFGANSVTYAYTPAATTRQTLTYHNGTSYVMTVDRDFDKMDRQASQSAAITGDDTHSYSYTYNDLNQRTHVPLARGEYWHYGYDSLGQVDSAVKKTSVGSAIPGYSYGFTFDHIGNRTDSTINGRTDSYTPNLLNQYTSRNISRAIDVRGSALSSATVTVDGQATTRTGDHFYKEIDLSAETSPNDARTVDYLVTATLPDGGYNNTPRVADVEGEEFLKANPESFDYNDDGNLLFDGKWDYTWNAENRLIQAVTKSSAVTAGAPNLKLAFAYDSQGRRFQKDVYEHDGSEYVLRETKYFIYDGWNLIAELDADLDLKNSYVWGTDLSGSLQGAGGVGGLLFAYDSWTGVIAAPWFDGNGNAMGYLDMADGSVVADYEYGALGEQVRSTGPMANALSFRFSTKYLDTELDLLYYGYRYYSPESGRWLTPDPIAESGGLNVYSITENNPISKIDALGLYSLKDARKSLEQRGEKKLGSQVGGSHTKMYSNQQVFDEWYRLEKSRGSWWTSLPKCPIKLCITRGEGRNRKTRYAENSYAKNKENWHDPKRPSNAELNLHPGTYFSMRSKADSHGHANQCTYDRDGNLLRFAPGSGTVDWYRSGTATHYDHDVAPAYLANRLDGGANMGVVSSTITGGPSILGSPGHNLRKYYEVRPLWAESKE
jgi:RHS repeat-associated protein